MPLDLDLGTLQGFNAAQSNEKNELYIHRHTHKRMYGRKESDEKERPLRASAFHLGDFAVGPFAGLGGRAGALLTFSKSRHSG